MNEEHTIVESDFVLGCDGVSSTIRDAMEKESDEKNPFFVERYQDTNQRVYKSVPLYLPFDEEREQGQGASEEKEEGKEKEKEKEKELESVGIGIGKSSNSNSNEDFLTSSNEKEKEKEKETGMSKEKKQIKWRRDLNYSCRTKSDINIDALPLADGVHLGIVLYRPW